VSQGVPYLHSLAHALTTMQLYAVGHPARSRVGAMTYARLRALLDEDPCPHFTFMDGAVILGNNPLPDLQHWPWAKKLNQMGVQRLEFDPTVSLESYGLFLEDLLARITTDREHTIPLPARDGIKSGLVRVSGELEAPTPEAVSAGATLPYSLGEEADIVRWIYERAEMLHDVPLDEVEGVVRSLAVAMHADGELLLPLLQLRNSDEYAARHAINVAIIAMTFAETLDMAPRDVRAFGIAGLLHDIGMTGFLRKSCPRTPSPPATGSCSASTRWTAPGSCSARAMSTRSRRWRPTSTTPAPTGQDIRCSGSPGISTM